MTPQQLHKAALEVWMRLPNAVLVPNKVGNLEIRTSAGAAGVIDLHDGSVDWWGVEPDPSPER